ncbi:MAG: methyltransferase [Bacteroidia bacterium]|jgi:tRNA1Val (adenine37-N6)-methyltransferase|nr:methyltransferase [Bacteroidia bacterium]
MSKVRKPFAMKQFTIAHDKVALPVTSDACLFGSMIDLPQTLENKSQPLKNVLDVGTGTGLLCLMLAQKHPHLNFVGIDIHEASVEQALQNVINSPFNNQIRIDLANILSFSPKEPFDAIVCNPPFFEHQLPSSDETRRIARHSDTLNLNNLLLACHEILITQGYLYILYPVVDPTWLLSTLQFAQFELSKLTYIRATETKKPHLMLIQAKSLPKTNNSSPSYPHFETETITHYQTNGQLTPEATHYLQEFYSSLP